MELSLKMEVLAGTEIPGCGDRGRGWGVEGSGYGIGRVYLNATLSPPPQ